MFNLVSTRNSRSFSCQAAFRLGDLQHVLVPEVVPPQRQDWALLLELYEVPISPFLQPFGVSLDNSTALWHVSRFSSSYWPPARLCVVSHHPETQLGRTGKRFGFYFQEVNPTFLFPCSLNSCFGIREYLSPCAMGPYDVLAYPFF